MIAIVHSTCIYSQSVPAPALHAGSMDNDAGRYCSIDIIINKLKSPHNPIRTRKYD